MDSRETERRLAEFERLTMGISLSAEQRFVVDNAFREAVGGQDYSKPHHRKGWRSVPAAARVVGTKASGSIKATITRKNLGVFRALGSAV